MTLTELVFDEERECFLRKNNKSPVDVKALNPPMELTLYSNDEFSRILGIYKPRNANAYCIGLRDKERVIIQYYKILAEYKRKEPSHHYHLAYQ